VVTPRLDEIWLVALDPTRGHEMQKTRPCLVISPDEMNTSVRTVLIAPLTSVVHPYPSRVPINFHGHRGQIALDQMRAVDHQRLIRRLGRARKATALATAAVLVEMFTRT
jgi:mRNA interferase MazF